MILKIHKRSGPLSKNKYFRVSYQHSPTITPPPPPPSPVDPQPLPPSDDTGFSTLTLRNKKRHTPLNARVPLSVCWVVVVVVVAIAVAAAAAVVVVAVVIVVIVYFLPFFFNIFSGSCGCGDY